ncbi:carbohydrate ABC transporter permease, partial [Microbacterium wangchenii]
PRAADRRRTIRVQRATFIVAFLVLPVTVFVVFIASPFLQAFYYSLTDWRGFSQDMNFVGLANFTSMFGDPVFLAALRNSLLLCLVLPTAVLAAAFLIAFTVTAGGPSVGHVRGLRGGGFYRIITFFPYTIPAIVVGLIWAQVYDPTRGLLNSVLTGLGFTEFASFAWLGDADTAMAASMFVIFWALVGFYVVLFIAAIKGIPGETYEAARLDGAGRARTAWSITLPQILASIQSSYVYLGLMVIDSFGFMMVLNPQGGPAYSTLTLTQYLYMTAFTKGQFGDATAMGVFLALVILIYSGIIFGIFRLLGGDRRRGAGA